MAKKTKRPVKKTAPKSGVNKAEEIRKELGAAPDKSPREISEALAARGIDATPAHVSTVKSNMKAKAKTGRKKKVVRKKQAPKAAPSSQLTFEQLCMAKELTRKLGGLQQAHEALAALSDLLE